MLLDRVSQMSIFDDLYIFVSSIYYLDFGLLVKQNKQSGGQAMFTKAMNQSRLIMHIHTMYFWSNLHINAVFHVAYFPLRATKNQLHFPKVIVSLSCR